MTIKRATVYCASSLQSGEAFLTAAEQTAKTLVKENIEIIYGGGSSGLMGKLADTAIAQGGKVTGIMPEFMKSVEWNHSGVSSMIYTSDMSERKKKLIENTDAVITLAGGCGTLEELLEVITLKRLGIFLKPIIIVNTNSYYDPLLEMFENMIDNKFLAERHRQIWSVVKTPAEIIDAIRNAPVWNEDARNYALVT